jgi:hypothetical protein
MVARLEEQKRTARSSLADCGADAARAAAAAAASTTSAVGV